MPQYDLAGNPLPEKNTDQNAPLGGDPPPVQRPLYAQGAQQTAPTRYDMAGNPLPSQNPPAAAAPTRYDFAGNPIAAAPPATPYYAAPPAAANSTWPPPPNNAGYGRPTFVNTSGSQGDVPFEIANLKWNWGAFLLPRLWCYRHGLAQVATMLWVSLFIIRFLNNMMTGGSALIPIIVTLLLDWGIGIYLGFNGHRIAWRNRRFDDITEFFKVQRAWLIGGIVWQVFLNGLFLFVIFSVAAMK